MKSWRGSLHKSVLCLALAGGAWAGAKPALAQAPFYQGRTIQIVVGFGPGGGYDAYARLIARTIGSHIPGNPTLIVQNMPGAGSRVAANWLYNVAPRDGTAPGMFCTISVGLPGMWLPMVRAISRA